MDRSLKHHCQTGYDIGNKMLGAEGQCDAQCPDNRQDGSHADADVGQGKDQESKKRQIADQAPDQPENRLPLLSCKRRTDSQQDPDQDHAQQDLSQKEKNAREREKIQAFLPLSRIKVVIDGIAGRRRIKIRYGNLLRQVQSDNQFHRYQSDLLRPDRSDIIPYPLPVLPFISQRPAQSSVLLKIRIGITAQYKPCYDCVDYGKHQAAGQGGVKHAGRKRASARGIYGDRLFRSLQAAPCPGNAERRGSDKHGAFVCFHVSDNGTLKLAAV